MKRLLIVLGVLCLLALSVTGIVLMLRYQRQVQATQQFIAAGPTNLAREEAADRQAGIPLDPQQLQRPLPPQGQNAAPLYTKLTQVLHDRPLGLPKYAEGMDAFHAYTPAQITATRQRLAARQDVMMLIHQAADRPNCVFVRDWSQVPDLTFPEYNRMREAARLLKTESYLLALDGHYQEAIQNQALGFQVAKHAASDSMLISYLVGVANQAITLSGMQSILVLAGSSAAVINQVQQTVRRDFIPLSLRSSLVTEPAAMEPIFQQLHQGQHQGFQWFMSSLGNLTSGKNIESDPSRSVTPVSSKEQKLVSNTIDAQKANYLLDMRRMIAAANAPQTERLSVSAALEDASAPTTRNGARTMSFILMPDFGKIAENDTRIRAREAVTLAAATILGGKAKTGAFPDSLPPGLTDPFTDKSLLYRREGSGFVICSAGPTGHFDGGKPGEKVPGTESLFRYPAVPAPMLKEGQ